MVKIDNESECAYCKHHRAKHHPSLFFCRSRGCSCPMFLPREDVVMRGVSEATLTWIKENWGKEQK